MMREESEPLPQYLSPGQTHWDLDTVPERRVELIRSDFDVST